MTGNAQIDHRKYFKFGGQFESLQGVSYSPKARFINDNFHHSQPLPENYNFSASTLIWKNLTWKIPTNPTTFNIEKSAVIFRFNLGQLCRECKHICKH